MAVEQTNQQKKGNKTRLITRLKLRLQMVALKLGISLPILTEADIMQFQQEMNEQKDSKSYAIFHSIDDCPFTIFENCLLNAKYDELGDAPESVLQEAWLNIYSEYISAINDGSAITKIQEMGKINAMTLKVKRLKELVHIYLETEYGVYLDCLKESGFKIEKESDLKQCIGRIKQQEVELNMLIKNISETKGEDGKGITKEYFTKILTTISIAFKIPPIQKQSITVAAYCSYYSQYNEYCKQILTQSRNGRAA